MRTKRSKKVCRTPRLVEEWRRFDKTVDETRNAFVDIPAEELQNIIDEAVKSARRKRYIRKRRPGERD